jgi:hypothetical protein
MEGCDTALEGRDHDCTVTLHDVGSHSAFEVRDTIGNVRVTRGMRRVTRTGSGVRSGRRRDAADGCRGRHEACDTGRRRQTEGDGEGRRRRSVSLCRHSADGDRRRETETDASRVPYHWKCRRRQTKTQGDGETLGEALRTGAGAAGRSGGAKGGKATTGVAMEPVPPGQRTTLSAKVLTACVPVP